MNDDQKECRQPFFEMPPIVIFLFLSLSCSVHSPFVSIRKDSCRFVEQSFHKIRPCSTGTNQKTHPLPSP